VGKCVLRLGQASERGHVAEETRRHVLRIIAELGFEPNGSARSLKRGRISSIGFVVPDLGNPFFAAVAEGIHAGIADNDILLMLCITGSLTEREEYRTDPRSFDPSQRPDRAQAGRAVSLSGVVRRGEASRASAGNVR